MELQPVHRIVEQQVGMSFSVDNKFLALIIMSYK